MGRHARSYDEDMSGYGYGLSRYYPDEDSYDEDDVDEFWGDGDWSAWDDDEDFYSEEADTDMTEAAEEQGLCFSDAPAKQTETVTDTVQEALKKLMEIRKEREEREQREKEIRESQERAERIKKALEEQEKKKAEEARVQSIMDMEMPLDLENLYSSDSRAEGVHADSPADGLILSLTNLGRVDIEYISQITDEDYGTVIRALRGSIYQNPEVWDECFWKGWETADEYLSGNLVRKLKAAKEADAKMNGYFAGNIEALESVMPEKLSQGDIYVTLGSPWVPEDVIYDFMSYLLGRPKKAKACGVKRDAYTGAWEITDKWAYGNIAAMSVKLHETYGTGRMDALEILERTLNMKSAAVYDVIPSDMNKSKKATVLNKIETTAAMEKQKLMISMFSKWVWKDKARAERLEDIYGSQYACVRKRTFDGSFLTFPGMAEGFSLYKYQKDAVARIIFTPNTLLAHEVGAGKTFIMAAAGMEMKRMGLSSKNLYVVPNNIHGQWKAMFRRIYPQANLLAADAKDFVPAKKHETMLKIRDGEYDAIIIPYSSFTKIPISLEYDIEECEEEIAKIKKVKKDKITARLNRRRTVLENRLEKLKEQKKDRDKEKAGKAKAGKATAADPDAEEEIFFDDLGVTRLFIDEAHNFKNLPIETNVDRVLGINPTGSRKCEDMYRKVCMVQKRNNGGGVVMATGTPITNSVTDVFVMQKYLQGGELALLDLQNFDSWVAMFGEKVTDFEIDVDTSGYRLATRFASFHNLPELTSLLASIADFHRMDNSEGVPETDGYTDCLVKKTPEFDAYLKTISERADKVRAGGVDRHKDNMLKITTDGRQAALDLRLVKPDASCSKWSKVEECAENVYYAYLRSNSFRGTQLVFCDTSTPKEKFNIYDELRSLLVEKGIPRKEIAYIHDAQSEKTRSKLFEDMRSGRIRVLIGSTFKMGLGMNVQDKLIALHHIDIPWRPADMVQREGRILRPGNTNKKVYIYRYITEGSFDAYSWQLLETKQRFISDLLSGSYSERSGGDIKDAVLDYAEVKALAVGNPLLKERVKTANELTRLQTLQRKDMEDRLRMRQLQKELPGRIEDTERRVSNCEKDLAWYQTQKARNADLEEWRAEKREKAKQAAESKASMDAAHAEDTSVQTEDTAVQAEDPAVEDIMEAETETQLQEDGLSAEEKARDAAFRKREKKLLEERRSVREQIYAAISAYDFSSKEEYICTYMGFKVFLPAGMSIIRPYVWLKRSGQYDAALGEKDKGYLTRIDNVLDALDKRLENLKDKAKGYRNTLKELDRELETDPDYEEKIAAVKKALAKIDKKLGVEAGQD
ncbi:MAG: DEAD/DEAH box helicase family protein [Clostridia bacterium]|nr:DEAD/DEAH box helicase family protein [Clostridia bacterium]